MIGLRRSVGAWFGGTPLRKIARRWTVRVLVAWLVQVVLATVLGRLGIVSQILSPNVGVKQVVYGLAAAVLIVLRITVFVIGPSVLAFVWVRALLSRPTPDLPEAELVKSG
jgi:hypothetical protein